MDELRARRCRSPLTGAERRAAAIAAVGALGFSAYGVASGAPSIVGYLVIVGGGLGLLLALRRSPLPDAVATGLAVLAVAHLAGGLIQVGDDVLYNASPGVEVLQYDHLVHSSGVFLGTIVVWLLLVQPVVGTARGRQAVLVCVLAGLGLGAINELVEFLATLAHGGSHVGGYTNTGWDLVANAVGASVAGLWIVGDGRRPIPEPPVARSDTLGPAHAEAT